MIEHVQYRPKTSFGEQTKLKNNVSWETPETDELQKNRRTTLMENNHNLITAYYWWDPETDKSPRIDNQSRINMQHETNKGSTTKK